MTTVTISEQRYFLWYWYKKVDEFWYILSEDITLKIEEYGISSCLRLKYSITSYNSTWTWVGDTTDICFIFGPNSVISHKQKDSHQLIGDTGWFQNLQFTRSNSHIHIYTYYFFIYDMMTCMLHMCMSHCSLVSGETVRKIMFLKKTGIYI